jgi:hypothetical protein
MLYYLEVPSFAPHHVHERGAFSLDPSDFIRAGTPLGPC